MSPVPRPTEPIEMPGGPDSYPLLAVWLVAAVVVIGCVSNGPSVPSKPEADKPVVAETVFSVLSDRATKSPEHYGYTDDIRRVVIKLREAGDITDAQVQAFDMAIPKERRKLTADDLAKVRGL